MTDYRLRALRAVYATRRLLAEGRPPALGRGSIALTFDDGPDPVGTPGVLDALAAVDGHATFFCTGRRAERHPELVRRILDEGHALGSHSYSHAVSGLPRAETVADYDRGRAAVEAAAGRPVRLFRPPHGALGFRTALALRTRGYRTRLWSLDPEDYLPGRDPAAVRAALAEAPGGAVVLLHDGLEEALPGAPDRRELVSVLPAALESLQARGLRPVALS